MAQCYKTLVTSNVATLSTSLQVVFGATPTSIMMPGKPNSPPVEKTAVRDKEDVQMITDVLGYVGGTEGECPPPS